jgi:hypothetical protein
VLEDVKDVEKVGLKVLPDATACLHLLRVQKLVGEQDYKDLGSCVLMSSLYEKSRRAEMPVGVRKAAPCC